MTTSATASDDSKQKIWPIRLTLYQTFMLFSIVAAWLLLHRIEGQQTELRNKRATLFSLNRDLYVDDPNRLAGIQRFVSSPHELSWSVFIPRTAQATLMVSGQAVCKLDGGMHEIRAKLHRQIALSGPAQIDVEKLFVDDVGHDVNLRVLDTFDDPHVKEPVTAAVSERLPLLVKPGDEPELQMWVETK